MGDPRWTIEDEALGPQRPMLVFDEPGFGQVIAVCMARRSGRTVIAPTASDALVAAVRDADLLRRARQLASSIRVRFPGDSDWEECISDLVDLLAPVPDTQEETR